MPNTNPEEVDRLSDLPEALLLQIISLLPTKFAVRTSLVARRFRDLWTASSSLELDRSDFPHGRLFNDVTFRCLRLRDPSSPLLNFCLKTQFRIRPFHINFITKWLNHANSLGMRDLSLHIHYKTIVTLLPLIIGLRSLQSLVINAIDLDCVGHFFKFQHLIPPSFSQTELKYLHIKAKLSSSDLTLFISGLRNLEHLWVEPLHQCEVDLSSPSMKILKLTSQSSHPKISLSFPNLEFLDLSIWLDMRIKFHGEMPILRSAVLTISSLGEEDVPVLCDILRSVSNVSELRLHIVTLHLKRLAGAARRRKHDLPSGWDRTIAPELWHSKLPLNSEGNRKYADFINLATGDKKSEVMTLLSSENPSKRLKN